MKGVFEQILEELKKMNDRLKVMSSSVRNKSDAPVVSTNKRGKRGRPVVAKTYEEGLSLEEAAKQLGLTKPNLRALLVRKKVKYEKIDGRIVIGKDTVKELKKIKTRKYTKKGVTE